MPRSRHISLLTALALLIGATATTLAGPSPATAATTATSITVDGTSPGRIFDGVGAISGGGGNSRLLTDYPPAQQHQSQRRSSRRPSRARRSTDACGARHQSARG